MYWMVSTYLIFFDAFVLTIIIRVIVQIMTGQDIMLEPIKVFIVWFFVLFLFLDLCLLRSFLFSLFSFFLFILLCLFNLFISFAVVTQASIYIYVVYFLSILSFSFTCSCTFLCLRFFSDLPSISFFLLYHFSLSLSLFIVLLFLSFSILHPKHFILFLFFSRGQLSYPICSLQF